MRFHRTGIFNFTEFAEKHSKVGGVKADEQIIKLLNPTKFIGECDTTKNWRIRHGAFDRDTSIAIPVILATMLKNKGYEVDFSLPCADCLLERPAVPY